MKQKTANKLEWRDAPYFSTAHGYTVELRKHDKTWVLLSDLAYLGPVVCICGTLSLVIGYFTTRERAKRVAELIARG